MAQHTHVVFTATYQHLDDAEADYRGLRNLHHDMGLRDHYDIAVIHQEADGKVRVVKKHESAPGVEGLEGGGIGLATALVLGVFPAAVLTAGTAIGMTAIGAAVGGLIGHETRGMSKKDLREIGDLLGGGEAGLVLVAGADAEKHLELGILRADKVMRKEVQVDHESFMEALRKLGQA